MTAERTKDHSFADRQTLGCLLLICACFTLTSEAYIAWLYHLMELSSPTGADWYGLVISYDLQAVGMALATLYLRRTSRMGMRLFASVIMLHLCFALPAAGATTAAVTCAFGALMAVACGVLQAFYLTRLASSVPRRWQGSTLGLGYACSTGLTWMLSLAREAVGGGALWNLIACAVLSLAAVTLVLYLPQETDEHEIPTTSHPQAQEPPLSQKVLPFACLALALMSAEKSLGFGFPLTDLQLGVSVEFSRLFYAAGMVVAGLATDHDRMLGTLCGMAALVTPFALLALSAEPVYGTVLWSLDYLLYGFFALFRMMLFIDLSLRKRDMSLACSGLLMGRIGDALGSAFCLTLAGQTVTLVSLAGVMLLAAAPLALWVLRTLYAPAPTVIVHKVPVPVPQDPTPVPTTADKLSNFCRHYDLSRREQEVLGELIARHTTKEASEHLFVSESTIKFHVHNILQKTACANRAALRKRFDEETEQEGEA